MKVILLTNDDGIEAEGLKTLEKVLQDLAHIVVVAPDEERSAVSHGLMIHTPLEFKEIDTNHYVMNGTPADCVINGLHRLFVQNPDLVISGINHGANVGDHIMYSGTVAGAREASRYGIPALALSQEFEDGKPIRFKKGEAFVRDLVQSVLRNGLNGELCLNVNIPVGKIKGVKITRQGCSEHKQHFVASDAGEDDGAVMMSTENSAKADIITDRQAIKDHYISITPMQRDQTDYVAVQALLKEGSRFYRS